MTEAPSRGMLLELGEDLGHPGVQLGSRTIAGVEAWRAAAAVATPPERAAWLLRLSEHLLVATPHARARLDAWTRSPIRTPGTAAWIRDSVLFFGDRAVLDYVVAALLFVPPPVRDFVVVQECCFEAVGADSYAWIGSSRKVDRDGRDRPRTIVLSGAAPHLPRLIGAVLHEISHAWTTPTPSVLVTVQGEEGLRNYLTQQGLTERFDKQVGLDERLARALASVWAAQGEE